MELAFVLKHERLAVRREDDAPVTRSPTQRDGSDLRSSGRIPEFQRSRRQTAGLLLLLILPTDRGQIFRVRRETERAHFKAVLHHGLLVGVLAPKVRDVPQP